MERVREKFLSIECHFINGLDAQGCKVVVVSDHSSVGNITTMLIRHNESDSTASGQVSLTYQIDCYHHVLAFDIEANGTISSLARDERIIQPRNNTNILINMCKRTEKGIYNIYLSNVLDKEKSPELARFL